MKVKMLVVLTMLFGLCFSVYADAPEVKQGKQGLYSQTVGNFQYGVDINTQICFMVGLGSSSINIAPIPCENLAKRAEWKTIITWVK